MTVLTERMDNMRSVCLGIWVKVGSRSEPASLNGISHFLEHMFFKGTRTRTAADIARSMDSLGGDINAFTSKEGTTFYIKVLDEHLERALDVLADIFMHSTFPKAELKRERGVITEEIRMVEDTPDDHIHDIFNRSVWGSRGIGQTVLGTERSIKRLGRDDLLAHTRRYYGTSNAVISCAGNFNERKLKAMLNEKFGSLRKARPAAGAKTPAFRAGFRLEPRELSEAHVCLGIKGVAQSSQDRYAVLILNSVLGGGMSSRLFQEIREKRGLVYTVYSFLSSFSDTGMWGVYAATGKKNTAEVIKRAMGELGGLSESITADELRRAKDQIKGNIMLGLESTSRRMQNIATQELYYGRHYSPAQIIKAIEAVTLGETRELASRLTAGKKPALTVLGRFDERSIVRPEAL